jgi:hypothetical protein
MGLPSCALGDHLPNMLQPTPLRRCRHRLATAVLPASVAGRFPDLRAIPLRPAMTWTLSIATAASQSENRAINALVDTMARHVG